MLLQAQHVVTPSGLVDGGWVEVEDGRIRSAGTSPAPGRVDEQLSGTLVPGFVDVHVHGGGGVNFADGAEAAQTVLDAHLAHGTTTMVASLVTASLDDLEEQVRALTPLVRTGKLAGIHLEGPWLAPEHKGAHDPELLRDPSTADVDRLLEAGRLDVGGRLPHTVHGWTAVRMVTVAPERDGGLDAVAQLAHDDVVAAVGHTDADLATAEAAIKAGARGATHLFNAMPEMLHRAPGPALALWRDASVWVELICDGVHVTPQLVAQVMATKRSRCVLVTDAMAAAAADDGDYRLGSLDVEVRGGVARLAGTDTIAGSTLTLDRAVKTAVAAGVPPELAIAAASSHAADYLGLEWVGRISPGCRADLVVLDDAYQVRRVMHRGAWVKR
ncbi:MAG: N-acetylglucosamine-6-phosphate deacetylase [Propionibacteriaceae bacterium]|nr:N-acetylglucosamine-6-phosphate deacetylase [Propionibacteriaceae bacterium]